MSKNYTISTTVRSVNRLVAWIKRREELEMGKLFVIGIIIALLFVFARCFVQDGLEEAVKKMKRLFIVLGIIAAVILVIVLMKK